MDNKLSENDSKVYLITTYYNFVNSTCRTKHKKDFLGLYFDDISWNNASADKINTKFAELIKDVKIFCEMEMQVNFQCLSIFLNQQKICIQMFISNIKLGLFREIFLLIFYRQINLKT